MSLTQVELEKAYPWALRVAKFDDYGLDSATIVEIEKAIGHPMQLEDRRSHAVWVPRSKWQPGPWMDEPDFVEWRATFVPYPLLIARGGMGALCGYVGLPPSHPLHGKSYQEVSWGVNWAGPCGGLRIPTGEPPDCWWLGFDCGHGFQYSPAMEGSIHWITELTGIESPGMLKQMHQEHYVSIKECREMTEALALVLRASESQREKTPPK